MWRNTYPPLRSLSPCWIIQEKESNKSIILMQSKNLHQKNNTNSNKKLTSKQSGKEMRK